MSKTKPKNADSYYETKVNCKNCRNEVEISVPMGVTVKDFCKKNKCEICKCDLL